MNGIDYDAKSAGFHMERGNSNTHSMTKEEIYRDIDEKARKAIEGAEEFNKRFLSGNLKVNNSPEMRYYELSGGLIIKIDTSNDKLYILDEQSKTWRENFSLMAEYNHGDLNVNYIEFSDYYEIGEPWTYDAGKRERLING